MSVAETASRIELLLSDVDGVMTDGGLTFDDRGVETKTFSVRDGLGVKLWRRFGGPFGIHHRPRPRRSSKAASRKNWAWRSSCKSVTDKLGAATDARPQSAASRWTEIAYIGDDLPDAPLIRAVGPRRGGRRRSPRSRARPRTT